MQQPNSAPAIFPAVDIEQAILGCLMSDPGYKVIQEIAGLREQEFYDTQDQIIFAAILRIIEKGITPSLPVIYQEATTDPELLSKILAGACFPSQFNYYVDLLHKNYAQRRLERSILQAQANLSEGLEYEEIESQLVNSLSKDRNEATTFGITEGYDVDQLLSGSAKVSGVLSGLEEIDLATAGGIMPGEVCICAARTSVGKSAWAIRYMLHAVRKAWPVLYLSYEMPRSQLWRRSLSYWSTVSLRKFRQGYFDDFDKARIKRSTEDLKEFWPHIRVNCKANKPGDLLRLIRMEQLKYGEPNPFVIIDHAGRMLTDSKVRSDYERASEIVNRIKDIALQCNIPILVLWQLSRGVEKDREDGGKKPRKPTLSDLRDSGQAEEIADTVLLMSRDNYYDNNIPINEAMVTVNVAKARDGGKTGEVQVPWLSIISRPEQREAGDS